MLNIKSAGDALEFWVEKGAPYGQVWEILCEKMETMRGFYKGSSMPALFFGKKYTEYQKQEIRSYLQRDIGIRTVIFPDDEDIVEMEKEEPVVIRPKDKFFQGTLRSGQRLESEGNIIVVGDVNAGAELIADGNIVVFGKLRGLAHAGAMGRTDVIIAANGLIPQQVRIGGKIAIIPAGRHLDGPEIVRIRDGKIIVDSMS